MESVIKTLENKIKDLRFEKRIWAKDKSIVFDVEKEIKEHELVLEKLKKDNEDLLRLI